ALEVGPWEPTLAYPLPTSLRQFFDLATRHQQPQVFPLLIRTLQQMEERAVSDGVPAGPARLCQGGHLVERAYGTQQPRLGALACRTTFTEALLRCLARHAKDLTDGLPGVACRARTQHRTFEGVRRLCLGSRCQADEVEVGHGIVFQASGQVRVFLEHGC